MATKVNYETANTPKLFKGKPKDFEIVTANGAKLNAKLGGTTVTPRYNVTTTIGANAFNAAGLREVAEHFAELADIMDGKIKTDKAA